MPTTKFSIRLKRSFLDELIDLYLLHHGETRQSDKRVDEIKELAEWSGTSGSICLTFYPPRQRRQWSEQEEDVLIAMVSNFRLEKSWQHGKRTAAWAKIAETLQRPLRSVQGKYEALRRQGRIK